MLLDDLELERVAGREGVWQLSLHFCEREREDPLWAYRFTIDVDALAPLSGAFFGRIR